MNARLITNHCSSGRRGSVLWHTNQDNVKRTLAVVQILSKEFEKTQYNGVVTAVQYLNEPVHLQYTPSLLCS